MNWNSKFSCLRVNIDQRLNYKRLATKLHSFCEPKIVQYQLWIKFHRIQVVEKHLQQKQQEVQYISLNVYKLLCLFALPRAHTHTHDILSVCTYIIYTRLCLLCPPMRPKVETSFSFETSLPTRFLFLNTENHNYLAT